MTKNKPIAVLISDVHYNLSTLELADKAMRMAINKANELNLPLVVCGDLHDTKASLRGECVKAILDTIQTCKKKPYVIVANHDRINERAKEHSLEFLRAFTILVESPVWVSEIESYLIPYHSQEEGLEALLESLPRGIRLIMHQGLQGADMGHYVLDKSSLPQSAYKDFRVISGHYHRRQDIPCGKVRGNNIGLFSYVGNPYTLSFSEAKDPPKGFQILLTDGSLEFVPTNLRKHVIVESKVGEPITQEVNSNDLLWLRITGESSALRSIKKQELGHSILGHNNYKLELIPQKLSTLDDCPSKPIKINHAKDIYSNCITETQEPSNVKDELNSLFKELYSE